MITRNGQGRVISQEILARKLIVSFDDGRRVMTDESDIVTVISRGSRPRRDSSGDDDQNDE